MSMRHKEISEFLLYAVCLLGDCDTVHKGRSQKYPLVFCKCKIVKTDRMALCPGHGKTFSSKIVL